MKTLLFLALTLISGISDAQKEEKTVHFYRTMMDDTIANICAPYSCYKDALRTVKSEWKVAYHTSNGWNPGEKLLKKHARWNKKSHNTMLKRHGENWEKSFVEDLLKENSNHTSAIFGIRAVEKYKDLEKRAKENSSYYLIVNIFKQSEDTYSIKVDINGLLDPIYKSKRCMGFTFKVGDEKATITEDIENNYFFL